MVLASEVLEGANEGGAVVGHYFANRAPATQDILENPVAKGLRSLVA